MHTNNRDAYRQAFFNAWQKHQKKLLLEPIEAQLVEVILLHPEFHLFLDNAYQHQEFTVEENPFVHMSLHLAIREQINTNRPAGIAQLQHELMTKHLNLHQLEHKMMESLAQMIWTAQQTGVMPSDAEYLAKLKEIS